MVSIAARMKGTDLELELSGSGPKKRLFFNTYLVSSKLVSDFVAMEFAFVRRGEPIDQFFCLAPHQMIEAQKMSFLKL